MRKPSPSGINYEGTKMMVITFVFKPSIRRLNRFEINAAAIWQMPRALQAALLEDSEQLLAPKTCSQVPESSDGERIASSTTKCWESKTKIHEFNKYSYFSSQRSNKERGHSERNACSQLILFLRRQLILKKGMSSLVMEEISLSA